MNTLSACRLSPPLVKDRHHGNRRQDRTALRRKVARRACGLVMTAAAEAFAIPMAELAATSRRPPRVAFARQSAMYLAHVAFGLSFSEIGRAFGRDRTTAAYACRLVEERRDNPAIDAVMASLESACLMLRARLGAAWLAEPAERRQPQRVQP